MRDFIADRLIQLSEFFYWLSNGCRKAAVAVLIGFRRRGGRS